MRKVSIYDTTLRDGAQAEELNLTCEDKVRIAGKLDELGDTSTIADESVIDKLIDERTDVAKL